MTFQPTSRPSTPDNSPLSWISFSPDAPLTPHSTTPSDSADRTPTARSYVRPRPSNCYESAVPSTLPKLEAPRGRGARKVSGGLLIDLENDDDTSSSPDVGDFGSISGEADALHASFQQFSFQSLSSPAFHVNADALVSPALSEGSSRSSPSSTVWTPTDLTSTSDNVAVVKPYTFPNFDDPDWIIEEETYDNPPRSASSPKKPHHPYYSSPSASHSSPKARKGSPSSTRTSLLYGTGSQSPRRRTTSCHSSPRKPYHVRIGSSPSSPQVSRKPTASVQLPKERKRREKAARKEAKRKRMLEELFAPDEALDHFFGVTPEAGKALRGGYGQVAIVDQAHLKGADDFRSLLGSRNGEDEDEQGDVEMEDQSESNDDEAVHHSSGTPRLRPPPLDLTRARSHSQSSFRTVETVDDEIEELAPTAVLAPGWTPGPLFKNAGRRGSPGASRPERKDVKRKTSITRLLEKFF